MKMKKCLKLITIVSVVAVCQVSSSRATLYKEGRCTSKDGSDGVYRRVSECPASQGSISALRRSELQEMIVCCSNTKGVQSMKRICEGPIVSNSLTSRSKRRFKIFGGARVIASEFPHMAAVGFVKRGVISWLCGATLVHKRFVLTAAHCLEDRSISRYGKARFVRLGDIDLKDNTDDVDVQMFSVVRRIPYPDYRAPQKYHDIALLQLDKDVSFDAFVKPACLHSQDSFPDELPIATGWGKTEKGRMVMGQKLLKVDLGFLPMQKCNDTISQHIGARSLQQQLTVGLLADSMLCVGVLEGGKDACQGDSGGPLQVRAHSPMCDFDVIGVISFGVMLPSRPACANPDTPAVYTRVSKYVPWIESVVCSYNGS